MVTLQVDGARLAFVAVEGTAGDARNCGSIDHSFAIQVHRDLASHQFNVVGLPLIVRFGGIRRRGQVTINSANVVALGFAAVIVLYLSFVATALLLPLG